jgi:heme a synthase
LEKASFRKAVVIWLTCVCLSLLVMMTVGGITRLTGSGLSIVDWNPIMGIIPPLTHQEWVDAFEKYKQFPQYKITHSHIGLQEFKGIFFWEYLHRLIGRLIGVVFALPFFYFLAKKCFNRRMAGRLGIAFVLGGSQGFLGWYMVKSGLVNKPYVSHYRLAAHLSLALLILVYIFRIVLDIRFPTNPVNDRVNISSESAPLRRLATSLVCLIGVQIVFGAFMAGLHAGIGYNTFPTMNGEWIPSKLLDLTPAWLNFFENTVAIQFTHRTLGTLILAFAAWLFIVAIKSDLS